MELPESRFGINHFIQMNEKTMMMKTIKTIRTIKMIKKCKMNKKMKSH